MRLGSLERNAGRLKDALAKLVEATDLAKVCGPWITGRCHLELASTYKDLAISEDDGLYVEKARHFYLKALYEFEAVGHHRYVAVVENNIGLLLLGLGLHQESEMHLLRAQRFFNGFADTLRGAQVNDTLARLYIDTKKYARAQEAIEQAVRIFELADGDAILADGLITKGIVGTRLGHFSEAKKSFEAACSISERCSDTEGAGLALLIMSEEMGDRLERPEKVQVAEKLKRLLAATQQRKLQVRLQRLLEEIASTPDLPPNLSEK
jgi:tetratricopeptide (TPR) repeat protein